MKFPSSFLPARTVSQPARPLQLAALALLIAAALVGRPVRAQVVAAADAGGGRISAGATASGFNLGYGDIKTVGASVFLDADTLRHFGFEGEVRTLPYHLDDGLQQTPYKNERAITYLAGARYFRNYNRFQPWAKCLAGMGVFKYPYGFAKDSDLVIEPGGGLDWKFNRVWRVRAEFDDQMWPNFHYGQLNNYGFSVGFRIAIR